MDKDEKIREAIEKLAHLNIGFSFDVVGMLCIRELESGEYAVSVDDCASDCWEELFPDLEDAISCFLRARKKYKLGTDFEENRESLQIGEIEFEYFSYLDEAPAKELWLVIIALGQRIPVLIDSSIHQLDEFEIGGENEGYPAIKAEKSEMLVRKFAASFDGKLKLSGERYLMYGDGVFNESDI